MSSVQQNIFKHKVGLLNLAAELGNVSRACKVTCSGLMKTDTSIGLLFTQPELYQLRPDLTVTEFFGKLSDDVAITTLESAIQILQLKVET